MPCHNKTMTCAKTSFSGCRSCQQTIQGDDDDDVIAQGNKVSLICPLTSATFKEPVQSKVRSVLPSGSAAKRLGYHSSLPWQCCGLSLLRRAKLADVIYRNIGLQFQQELAPRPTHPFQHFVIIDTRVCYSFGIVNYDSYVSFRASGVIRGI